MVGFALYIFITYINIIDADSDTPKCLGRTTLWLVLGFLITDLVNCVLIILDVIISNVAAWGKQTEKLTLFEIISGRLNEAVRVFLALGCLGILVAISVFTWRDSCQLTQPAFFNILQIWIITYWSLLAFFTVCQLASGAARSFMNYSGRFKKKKEYTSLPQDDQNLNAKLIPEVVDNPV
jgi:hypothetical protein